MNAPAAPKRKLIINSGDISDADGFYAIAKYAKDTDADVLFIMNYPGYMRMEHIDPGVQEQGLGYRYDTGTYLRAQKQDWSGNLTSALQGWAVALAP